MVDDGFFVGDLSEKQIACISNQMSLFLESKVFSSVSNIE